LRRIASRGAPALVALLLLACAVIYARLSPPRTSDAPPAAGLISYVVDGDTIHVEAGGQTYKVRLIGVDTPELHPSPKLDREAQRTHQDREAIRALGKRAGQFTRKLCKGQTCRLEYDPANVARGHRDDFGRLLAYVWIPGPGGKELLVNAEIIRSGYGRAFTRYPYDPARQAEFLKLDREARTHRRGLWGEWKD